MKYSSHHYLRTDGTLGRFPVIEVGTDGRITSVEEHADGLVETSGVRFYSGVIVPRFKQAQTLVFNSKSDFCKQISGRRQSDIVVGAKADFVLVFGFDQTTFVSSPMLNVSEILR